MALKFMNYLRAFSPVLLGMVFIIGCAESNQSIDSKPIQTQDTEENDELIYKIISDEKLGTEKRTVQVLLDQRISEQQLEKLAYKIQEMNSETFKRTFIMYEVKGLNNDLGMAWATTHFNPDLEVKILVDSMK